MKKHKEKREVPFHSFGQGTTDRASFIIPIIPLPVPNGLWALTLDASCCTQAQHSGLHTKSKAVAWLSHQHELDRLRLLLNGMLQYDWQGVPRLVTSVLFSSGRKWEHQVSSYHLWGECLWIKAIAEIKTLFRCILNRVFKTETDSPNPASTAGSTDCWVTEISESSLTFRLRMDLFLRPRAIFLFNQDIRKMLRCGYKCSKWKLHDLCYQISMMMFKVFSNNKVW